jgi:hypothetical protein
MKVVLYFEDAGELFLVEIIVKLFTAVIFWGNTVRGSEKGEEL